MASANALKLTSYTANTAGSHTTPTGSYTANSGTHAASQATNNDMSIPNYDLHPCEENGYDASSMPAYRFIDGRQLRDRSTGVIQWCMPDALGNAIIHEGINVPANWVECREDASHVYHHTTSYADQTAWCEDLSGVIAFRRYAMPPATHNTDGTINNGQVPCFYDGAIYQEVSAGLTIDPTAWCTWENTSQLNFIADYHLPTPATGTTGSDPAYDTTTGANPFTSTGVAGDPWAFLPHDIYRLQELCRRPATNTYLMTYEIADCARDIIEQYLTIQLNMSTGTGVPLPEINQRLFFKSH